MPPVKLLTIHTFHHLPGLGILVRGRTGPERIPYPLHTALLVRLQLPDGSHARLVATVEEVSHGNATGPALLLQTEAPLPLRPGLEIWLETETGKTRN